ncbi:MAG: calcium-binding EGF-like domain-containing protein [bacterium]
MHVQAESELEVLSVNDCFSLPCQHGGECRLLLPAPGFRCLCAPGYQAYNK